jgi:hypothetical protein
VLGLKRLRQEAYAAWHWLQEVQTNRSQWLGRAPLRAEDDLVGNGEAQFDSQFKELVRQRYGDLRYRCTWEKAAIDLTAHRMSQYYLEPHQIVGYLTSSDYLHCTIRQHYGERLIEAMLQFPEILEMLQDGLEHLYHVSDEAKDREIALKFAHKIARRLFPGGNLSRAA